MATAVKDLRIVIVGAGKIDLASQLFPWYSLSLNANYEMCSGMGGLASGLSLAKEGFQKIDVYEFASDLGFVGAGIQLAPNMARVLDRLGVWEPIAREATSIQDTSIRRTFFLWIRSLAFIWGCYLTNSLQNYRRLNK